VIVFWPKLLEKKINLMATLLAIALSSMLDDVVRQSPGQRGSINVGPTGQVPEEGLVPFGAQMSPATCRKATVAAVLGRIILG